MELSTLLDLSASGLRTQGMRMRTIAENLANQSTTATTPGGDPYRRKIATFKEEMDKASGVMMVKPGNVVFDQREFTLRYDPSHPSADPKGYVKLPNVNSLIEMADMREAQRSYEANLSVMESTRSMMTRTIDLLRA